MPALSVQQTLTQPDGDSFEARLWGDENGHGWETTDGYTVVKNSRTQFWSYAEKDGADAKKLTAAGIVGAVGEKRPLEKYIRPEESKSDRSFQGVHTQSAPSVADTASSVSGTRHLPVLLVNFNDTRTRFGSEDFEQLLFAVGNNSLRDFYEEASYGALTLTSGPNGVMGWYRAEFQHDYYGRNNDNGWDAHPATLVREAVAAADASVDFSQYDMDGDCYVDTVMLVHQGAGEEAGGRSTDIWSHRWKLSSAAYYGDGDGAYTTDDTAACGRIKINDYSIQPETLYGDIQTVGVFAHEYGHILGLPDLYDIDGSSNGIGDWGVMGTGSWNKVDRWGDSPSLPTAWSKYMCGWISPIVVDREFADTTISPTELVDNTFQFIPDAENHPEEYFLVENRQRIGFDAGLPGTGLAIWHIDDGMADYRNQDNTRECLADMDCSDSHYRVRLVQADGYWDLEHKTNRGDGSDLYPGQYGLSFFNRSSDPASLLYDGSSSQVSIADIIENGTDVRATFAYVTTITPATPAGGKILPDISTILHPGESITFNIVPNQGNEILSVKVDGQAIGAISEYTFIDDGARSCHQCRVFCGW